MVAPHYLNKLLTKDFVNDVKADLNDYDPAPGFSRCTKTGNTLAANTRVIDTLAATITINIARK